MNAIQINTAIEEAQRFLDRAQDAINRHKADEKDGSFPSNGYLGPSRESGALRRASLNLTRALADMRRP